MTSHADVRRERIDKIKNTLIEAKATGNPVDEDKLIGLLCYEYGCKEQTAKEYIKIARSVM